MISMASQPPPQSRRSSPALPTAPRVQLLREDRSGRRRSPDSHGESEWFILAWASWPPPVALPQTDSQVKAQDGKMKKKKQA